MKDKKNPGAQLPGYSKIFYLSMKHYIAFLKDETLLSRLSKT